MEENDFLRSVITVITSDTAVFWFSWFGVVVGFALSIRIAFLFSGIIRKMNEAKIYADEDIREYKIRKPILNRIEKIENAASNGFAKFAWRSAAMMFFGIVVPGLLLSLVVHFQHRLLPGPGVLLMGNEVLPTNSVSYFDTAVFVIDQALKGGLNDLMEVFGFNISRITNNPDQHVYTVMIYAFRLTCGAISGAIVYVAFTVFTGMRSLRSALANLKRQLAEMDARSANA